MRNTLFAFLVFAVAPILARAQGIITTVAGTGVRGYNGDNIPAVQAHLYLTPLEIPSDLEVFSHIAVDADGSIYIPDKVNNRIRKVLPNGVIVTVAGTGEHSFRGSNVPALEAALDWPASVILDSAGNFYIADQHNNRVRKVDANGIITTYAGNGDHGYGGNGGPALNAALDYPGGLAFDAAGNFYISDHHNNQIRRVSSNGSLITPYAGAGGPDAFGFAGDDGPARGATLDLPVGLAFDAAGNLYIADQHNNRVRRVSPGGIITTFAGDGQAAYGGDGGPATAASLNYPADVAVDAEGNVYIADQRNNRIRRVNRSGIITTVVGNGEQGFSGDNGPPLRAALARPSGVTFDRQGNLFITDHYNDRIRKVVFNPPALSLSASTLAFAATAGGANPPAQTLTLSNPGATALNFTVTDDQGWLSATPEAGAAAATAPVTLTVRVTVANLTPGDYSGVITVRSTEAVNSPQTVRVTLVVLPLAAPAPSFSASDVAHTASFARGPIAPGQLIAIFGSNLGPTAEVGAAIDPATGRLATTRAGVTVLFNDLPGPLLYVQQRQINVQVPYELAGQSSVRIVVRYLENSSAPVIVPLAAAAPGIFAASRGTGQAALLNQDSSLNSAANPAAPGSVVAIFLTGQGLTNPAAVTGALTPAPYPVPVLEVTVQIGGRNATTTFIGLAPELAGLLQINAVVPEETVPGDNVPLQVTIGAASSQPGVTLAVR